jgi:hypothetical protein
LCLGFCCFSSQRFFGQLKPNDIYLRFLSFNGSVII